MNTDDGDNGWRDYGNDGNTQVSPDLGAAPTGDTGGGNPAPQIRRESPQSGEAGETAGSDEDIKAPVGENTDGTTPVAPSAPASNGEPEGAGDGAAGFKGDSESEPQAEAPLSQADADFEDLVARLNGLQNPDLRHLEKIIAMAVRMDVDPGRISYLLDCMHELSGIRISTLKASWTDCRNTATSHGVLHSAHRVTEAMIKLFGQVYEETVFCEGRFWHYPRGPAAPDSNLAEDAGFFSSSSEEDLERTILNSYPGMPSMDTHSKRMEVVRRLTTFFARDGFFEDAKSGINLANGFLTYDEKAKDVRLLPHAPEFRARVKLAYDYDPAATAPTFEAGLEKPFSDPACPKAFCEFLGTALLGATPAYENARHVMFLIGPKKGGKSTMLDVARLVVPGYAVSSITPQDWGQDYKRAKLAGMTLNLVGEVSGGRPIPGDAFKSIASHEVITAREPYGRVIQFRARARHILAGNAPPRTDDKDQAFERPVLALSVDRTLAAHELDPSYLTKLKYEMPGVLAVLIRAGLNAMRRGRFELPAQHAMLVARMQHGDDVFVRFVLNRFERAPATDRPVSSRVIQARFMEYLGTEDIEAGPVSPVSIMKRVVPMLRTFFEAEKCDIGGVNHYRNVRLKQGPEPQR